MNFYWYISGQEVDMLHQNLSKNWWANFPLKFNIKTPWFDLERSQADAQTQSIKNLTKVVKKIEAKGELVPFENIEQEAPLFFSFRGAGIKLVEDDLVLVAIVQKNHVLLLTGAATNLVGNKVETLKLGASNSLVKSLKNTWSEQGGITDGSINEVVAELLKRAEGHVFPTITGVATFTSKLTAKTTTFKKIKRPELQAIIVGNPLYIEQVVL